MKDYFVKLNRQHSFNHDCFRTKGEVLKFGAVAHGVFYGIKYYAIEWIAKDSPLDLFPKHMHDNLTMRLMTINHAAYPHTDSGIGVTVNFYMNTTDEATNFYELNTSTPRLTKLENQTNGSVFSLSDLQKVCSFTARSGDVYALNVSKIHSVMNEDVVPLRSTREAIVVNSPVYTYEQLLSVI